MLLLCMRDIANNTPNQIKKLVHKMEENGFCEKSKKKNALIMEKAFPIQQITRIHIRLY